MINYSIILFLQMFLIQEKTMFDPELCKLREALKEAEARAKTQEDERNKALQHLQTSKEVSLKNLQ